MDRREEEPEETLRLSVDATRGRRGRKIEAGKKMRQRKRESSFEVRGAKDEMVTKEKLDQVRKDNRAGSCCQLTIRNCFAWL